MICVHDIIAITGLAVRVSIAYKDASHDYRHISEEVASLKLLIDRVAPHFRSNTISREDCHYGEKVLRGCQSVLEDLDSFIRKYERLASMNKRLVLNRVKLGKVDITALQVQLVSNVVLLNGFIRNCEYAVVQAQLAALLDPNGTNLRIPVTAIASFAANADTDTETAYKQFRKYLYLKTGATKDIIQQKEDEILQILRCQGMVASSQIGGKVEDQDRILDLNRILEQTCKEFYENLYQRGIAEDMLPPQDDILRILRSRGIVASSSRKAEDKDNSSSTKVIPSFRPSPQFWLNPEGIDRDDNSVLLRLVATNCHTGTMGLLFGKGAPIDQDNNSILHCTAGGGYPDTVKLLLDNGAPSEARNTDGNTPLHLAVKNGHPNVIKLLLEKGASAEALDKDKNTALHLAVRKGHIATLDSLLCSGASVAATDQYGNGPLHLAAQLGHTEVAEVLLKKGAPIEAKKPRHGDTPMHCAAYNGHTGAVELLLKRGALVEEKRADGNTPLHLAAFNAHTGVMELLLNNGASIEVKCNIGNTPLHYAAHRGHTGVVELLLNNGASIEARDKYNYTPLHLAQRNYHTDTVLFLKYRAMGFPVVTEFT